MKFLLAGLLLLLVALQYKAWFSDVGYFAAQTLEEKLAVERDKEAALLATNAQLVAEVVALQTGLGAVESMARRDLGMIKTGEQFYFVADNAVTGYFALDDSAASAAANGDALEPNSSPKRVQ